MRVVAGCRRSGTSLWMQICKRGGLPVVGEAFPRDWEALWELNREGFWESEHRYGVTENAEALRGRVVKMFVPGVLRTDVRHLEAVLITLRSWREHVASVERFEAVEQRIRAEEVPRDRPPALEWFHEVMCLLGDVSERGYPAMIVAYDTVLDHPRETIARAFDHFGHEGDIDEAVRAVRRDLRTFEAPETDARLDAETITLFDDLYERVRHRKPFDDAFIARLNETHQKVVTAS